jgi:antagonist of KipI
MTLRVVDPGLYSLVVDFGRPASRSLGVPVGGAADRFALALGNALVGNPPNTPALEITLAGPTVRAEADVACVVYGAPFDLAGPRPGLRARTTFTLRRSEELHVGGTARDVRAYLCVAGGFAGPVVLGSRSALEPVHAGDELPCAESGIAGRFIRPHLAWNSEPAVLRALPGPQAEWFRPEQFYGQEFLVTPETNRMGLRLEGEPLTVPARELLSEPVCPGAVQVTGNGQCVVLGVDGQTIGGYPKIAQVITVDLDKLGQLRPGARVRFREVNLEEAEELYRLKRAELGRWLTRLAVAETFGPALLGNS